jgi:hypothetical protein
VYIYGGVDPSRLVAVNHDDGEWLTKAATVRRTQFIDTGVVVARHAGTGSPCEPAGGGGIIEVTT